MNEKEIYAVYVGTMKIHKKYAAHVRDMAYLPALIADINQLNSAHNFNFCNAMTDILRQWFIGKLIGMDPDKLTGFYTDIWRFHKKYLNREPNNVYWADLTDDADELGKKYSFSQIECHMSVKQLFAALDELEIHDAIRNKSESPEGQKPESEQVGNEQKEKRESTTK